MTRKIPYLAMIAASVILVLIGSYIAGIPNQVDPTDEMLGTYDIATMYYAEYDENGEPLIYSGEPYEEAFTVFGTDMNSADCEFLGDRVIATYDPRYDSISFCWPEGEFIAWWNGTGFDLYFVYAYDGMVYGTYMYLTHDGSMEGYEEFDPDYCLLKEGDSFLAYNMYSIKEGVKTDYSETDVSFTVTKAELGFIFTDTVGTEEMHYLGVCEYTDFVRLYTVREDGTVIRDNMLENNDILYVYSSTLDEDLVLTTFVVKYKLSDSAVEIPLVLAPGMMFEGSQSYVIDTLGNRMTSEITVTVESVESEVVTLKAAYPTGTATWSGVFIQSSDNYALSTNLVSLFPKEGELFIGHYDVDIFDGEFELYGGFGSSDGESTGSTYAYLSSSD